MGFSTQLTNDESVFFDTDFFAEAVTYDGNSINVHFEYDDSLDQVGNAVVSWATIWVKASDMSGDMESQKDKAVVKDSVTWKVRNVERGDVQVWEIRLFRDVRFNQ